MHVCVWVCVGVCVCVWGCVGVWVWVCVCVCVTLNLLLTVCDPPHILIILKATYSDDYPGNYLGIQVWGNFLLIIYTGKHFSYFTA